MTTETEGSSDPFASIADAATAYAGLIEDENPETDNPEGETTGDEETAPDEEDLSAEIAEEEGDTQDEDENGSVEPAGGRFVSDDAKVRLADGTVTTVAELRKGNLFQADYTRKSMEVAETRKAVEADKARVQELESALAQQRETIAAVVEAFMPKPPDPSGIAANDIVGYQQYQMQKDAYERHSQMVARLVNDHLAMKTRQQEEESAKFQEARKAAAQKLLERAPDFANPEAYQKFWNEAVSALPDYDLTVEDLSGMNHHGAYLVLKDALAYRRIKAKHAEAKAKSNGKPPVLQGGNRRSPQAARQQASNAAMERLNRTGSVKDAVAALIASQEG